MKKSNLTMLLTEMVVMILIFALCAGVCLQLFGAARSTAQESDLLSGSAALCASAAEVCRAQNYDLDAAAGILGAERTDRGFVMTLNEDFAPDPAGPIRLMAEQTGSEARFSVYRGEEILFTMTAGVIVYEA